jgi:flavin-binding protein dodecin
VQGLGSFEVERIDGLIGDGGDVTYRVRIRVTFIIKERVHE